jgi:hypothetical protein
LKRTDRHWEHPHNPDILPNGNITFFANGMYNPSQPLHSRAMEMNPETGEIVWQYTDPQKWTFFSPIMGSVQRLASGNTLTIPFTGALSRLLMAEIWCGITSTRCFTTSRSSAARPIHCSAPTAMPVILQKSAGASEPIQRRPYVLF